MSVLMPNMYDEADSPADVAIVGLGPGGLAAAYKAAQKGLRVVAFTDRKDYIRGQRLVVSEETEKFLREIRNPADPLDQVFWDNYAKEGTLKTKDIEMYIYRKLETMENVTIVQATKGTEHAISAIKAGDGADYVELGTGEKYHFRHLLGADGARHGVADMVRDGLGKEISYADSKEQERHPYHAVVQLKLKEGAAVDEALKQVRGTKVAKLGWMETFMPKCYVFPNKDLTEFYFAGEVPQSIFRASEEDRPELLKQWAGAAIKEKYGVNIDDLEYRVTGNRAEDALQATVFEMRMRQSQHSLIDVQAGKFARIGDARRTPNYNLGHGMNDAIAGGLAFVECIGKPPHADEFDSAQFNRTMQSMDAQVERRMAYLQNNQASQRQKAQDELMIKINQVSTDVNETMRILEVELAKGDDRAAAIQHALDLCRGARLNLEVLRETVREDTNISSLLECMESTKLILTETHEAVQALHIDITPHIEESSSNLLVRFFNWLASLFSDKAVQANPMTIEQHVKSLEDMQSVTQRM
ncbi:NAD(P)/FAD-dependent oxidoreductase [Legionella oakridgensis]|nr:FAD-dependent oxidoreductase [Legionella oakridgensis]